MKPKPKVAILRGPLLNPFEMQSYDLLRGQFDLTALAPHETQFDLTRIQMPTQTLWCPIAGRTPFEREKRKFQALRDRVTGSTHSFCGLMDRLQGFDLYHIKDQPFCFSYEAALAKRKWGGKLVVTQMENIPFLNDHKFMERHIKRTVREQTDLFLAASEGAVQTLLLEGVDRAKIRRISNSVDVGFFSPGKAEASLRAALGIPPKAFVVMYVGRMAESKGVFTILEAAELLREGDIHFLLVGKDEEGLGAEAARRGLSGRVHLAGPVAYGDMPRHYRLADLSVLPSLPTKGWLEQFGYVLAESMACGVPPVGSDCGAIPEVIGDDARIFPAGSAEGLAGILRRLRKSPLGGLRKKSRERAVRLFSSKVLAAEVSRAYWDLLGGRGH